MAPSAPIVVALFRLSSATDDEQSMLQLPALQENLATDDSACRCPGYFEEMCTANADKGCVWHPHDGSNAPWCGCDEAVWGALTPPVFGPAPPPPPADPNAQAPAASCPSGWVQKGDIGADIGGCGLQSCDARYDINSEGACAARCDSNPACAGFSFAPMNGDRNHPGVSACTIYNSDTPTGTWTGTQGIATQVMCGREPVLCCAAMTATCMACSAGVTVEQYCEQNQGAAGCPTLRISGGSDTRGRLEIIHNGVWGTVCDDGFGMTDAQVACRHLGFSRAVNAIQHLGGGSGQIWLDDLACTGDEARLEDCPNRGAFGEHNCQHSEDVGIECSNEPMPDVQLRIAGGGDSGRLEILYNGQWGTVCDDAFDMNDAQVACRQMGYSEATAAMQSFGGGSGPIWLDNLGCSGAETDVQHCPHVGWEQHNCAHSEDVGVTCAGAAQSHPLPTRGYYRIQQKRNMRYLDAWYSDDRDYSVVTRDRQDNPSQWWLLEIDGTHEDQIFTVQHVAENDGTFVGRFMDAWNRDEKDYDVVTREEQRNDSQRWRFSEVEANTFTIVQIGYNTAGSVSGRYLDAYTNTAGSDYRATTREAQDNDTQEWVLTPLSPGEVDEAEAIMAQR